MVLEPGPEAQQVLVGLKQGQTKPEVEQIKGLILGQIRDILILEGLVEIGHKHIKHTLKQLQKELMITLIQDQGHERNPSVFQKYPLDVLKLQLFLQLPLKPLLP